MKIQIKEYLFDASEGLITFTDYTTIDLDSILVIVNVTDNIVIYNFADTTKGGTVSDNILTLMYNTSLMDNDDKLLIYYEGKESVVIDYTQEDLLNEIINQLKELNLQVKVLIEETI